MKVLYMFVLLFIGSVLFISCGEHVTNKDANGFYRFETVCDSFYYKSSLRFTGSVLIKRRIKVCVTYKTIKVYIPPQKLDKRYHKIKLDPE